MIKNETIQKLVNKTREEMIELKYEMQLHYISFQRWFYGGLCGSFFFILAAITIRYFFTPSP